MTDEQMENSGVIGARIFGDQRISPLIPATVVSKLV